MFHIQAALQIGSALAQFLNTLKTAFLLLVKHVTAFGYAVFEKNVSFGDSHFCPYLLSFLCSMVSHLTCPGLFDDLLKLSIKAGNEIGCEAHHISHFFLVYAFLSAPFAVKLEAFHDFLFF